MILPALAGVLALGLVGTGVAWASESDAPDAAVAPIREEATWTTGHALMGVWSWPEAGRVYRLGGSSRIDALDLQRRELVATATMTPGVWGATWESEYSTANGRPQLVAVDREQGRIFLPYRSGAFASADLGKPTASQAVAEGCIALAAIADPGCVGGLHVLDGRTLESLGRMPLSPPSSEFAHVESIPRVVSYAPPEPASGWGGRVLMVVEEIATAPWENSILPSLAAQVQNATPRRNSGNIAYAVAFDPESMRQEWAVRLEGCRNSREPRRWFMPSESFPTSIFRVAGEDPALYVGCHGNAAQQGVVVRVPLNAEGVPASLPVTVAEPQGAVDEQLGAEEPAAPSVVAQAPRQEVFPGPDNVRMILADPKSRRILMKVEDSGEVWWVFDGHSNQFVGTIGIGSYLQGHTTAGLDPDIGRLYVVAAKPVKGPANGPGGLYMADIRRDPLPQALHYPQFADEPRDSAGWSDAGGHTMNVVPRGTGGETTIFVSTGQTGRTSGAQLRVLVDATAAASDNVIDGGEAVRTLDLDEEPGVTEATFDGVARGFGFRTLLLGGVEGATRVGQADPLGVVKGAQEFNSTSGGLYELAIGVPTDLVVAAAPDPDPCSGAQRELIVAFVGPRGPAVVDASSARGEAQPLVIDQRTRDDLGSPVSRCAPKDWQALWSAALMSRPPMDEPGLSSPFEDATSSCTAAGEEAQQDAWSDPVTGAFSSQVDCSGQEVSGWGQARGVGLDGVSVASTLSSFRIYRDAGRGMVARVESIARGVDVGGVVKIDTIRGVAESWANGRKAAPVDGELDEGVFNPFNCDTSRPAGTCFQRHVFGVTVRDPASGKVGYRCGPCGPEDQFVEAMNRALGANANARFREPDRELARGSADGYVAAITKKQQERFSDIVLNADLLDTMVPMLEIVRYAPHNRPSDPGGTPGYTTGTPPRGRQIYQFAAVEVSSAYGIQCLLVYDAATNTCGAAPVEPGSITVRLADGEDRPLAGGAFELRADTDGDDVVGLKDTLVPNGACVTGADGTGTCAFTGLAPGGYLVSQIAAPPGHAKAAEPFAVQLESGEARTVSFVNGPDGAVIDVTATDEAGAPLAGATFAAYPDPDADGKVAPDAQPAATCTTDAAGACTMRVPAGSWVLVQTGAPGGLTPIEPVPFTLTAAGQTAAVAIVNYPADPAVVAPPPPAPAPGPTVVYTDPPAMPEPTVIEDDTPPAQVAEPEQPGPSVTDAVGGTVVKVIRAPGDALRLLSRSPVQALAWTVALALFAAAALAVQRRTHLTRLAYAPAGGPPPPTPPSAGPRPHGGPRPPGARPGRQPSGGATNLHTATALLERRVPRGAAPAVAENVTARVVVAVADVALAELVRAKLSASQHCEVLDCVTGFDGLTAALSAGAADVLVVDLGLVPDDASALWEVLPGLHAPERTVGLIPPDGSVAAMVIGARRVGIAGLLAVFDDLGNGQLSYAVRCVRSGKPFYGPSVQAVMLNLSGSRPLARVGLTDRELQIARLAASGVRRSEIAERLYLSPMTVKRHLHALRRKLGVNNPWDVEELKQRLAEAGLLEGEGDAARGQAAT